MIKKLITLFKIGRKLALSDALNIISRIYQITILIKIFFNLLGLFGKKNLNQNYNEDENDLNLSTNQEIVDNKFPQESIGNEKATENGILINDPVQEKDDKIKQEILLNKYPQFSSKSTKNIVFRPNSRGGLDGERPPPPKRIQNRSKLIKVDQNIFKKSFPDVKHTRRKDNQTLKKCMTFTVKPYSHATVVRTSR